MRLLSNEHTDIIEILKKEGLEKRASLVKKKGWVHIEIEQQSFMFHRKKVSSLVDGQFQDLFQYFIRKEKGIGELNSWSAVVDSLEIWAKNRFKSP